MPSISEEQALEQGKTPTNWENGLERSRDATIKIAATINSVATVKIAAAYFIVAGRRQSLSAKEIRKPMDLRWQNGPSILV
jgi:hypothetical protein